MMWREWANIFLKKKWRKCRKTLIFVALIITDLQRKCKNNAEKFGFRTILYYLYTRIWNSGVCDIVVWRINFRKFWFVSGNR